MSTTFVNTLIYIKRTLIHENHSNVSSLIKGPQQVAIVRKLAHDAPNDYKDVFETIKRLWTEGSLAADGSPMHSPEALALEICEFLKYLTERKRDEKNIFIHDALHIGQKLLKLVRFVLKTPHRPPGTASFRFPKSERRVNVLVAAEKFFERNESKEDIRLLKRELGSPSGLRDVSRKASVFGFDSPEGVHLLTPYETLNFPKANHTMTMAQLKELVSQY